MKKKRIIIDIRVPDSLKGQDIIAYALEEIRIPEFELDRTYHPVEAAPIDTLAEEMAAANQTLYNIRGFIPEDRKDKLQELACVVEVWTDARGETFEDA